MSLYHDLQMWEEKLSQLLAEAQELRQRVAEMEKQTAMLQERLVSADYPGGGLNALLRLYDDNFHICHAHFAELRDEECLFCLSLLYREGVKIES